MNMKAQNTRLKRAKRAEKSVSALLPLGALLIAALLHLSCRPQGGVYFANIKDGDQLASPFKVEMGVRGMEVRPAGELQEGSGHHHLLINEDPIPKGEVIINDETHLHFGGGDTETEIDLKPGRYRLTMQFADGAHRSYGERWATTIHVIVR